MKLYQRQIQYSFRPVLFFEPLSSLPLLLLLTDFCYEEVIMVVSDSLSEDDFNAVCFTP